MSMAPDDRAEISNDELDAMEESVARLRQRVRILREALERITDDFHDYSNFRDHDQLETLRDSINKGVAALEATKERDDDQD